MSVPEGYSAPPVDENICKLAIPVPGREQPILVELPRINWMPGPEVKKYREWLTPYGEAEAKWMNWLAENSVKPESEQAPKPEGVEELLDGFQQREVTLRWLKPYVSSADYRALMDKIPDGMVGWIKQQLSDPAIAVGESSASTDS